MTKKRITPERRELTEAEMLQLKIANRRYMIRRAEDIRATVQNKEKVDQYITQARADLFELEQQHKNLHDVQ